MICGMENSGPHLSQLDNISNGLFVHIRVSLY
jgi:hypothetical protein